MDMNEARSWVEAERQDKSDKVTEKKLKDTVGTQYKGENYGVYLLW